MSKSLRDEARKLAMQPYKIVISSDETTDGNPIIVVSNPELPGCMAQGETIAEAQVSLMEAREEYILSLLEDDLPVPLPEQYAIRAVAGTNTSNISSTTIGFNIAKTPSISLGSSFAMQSAVKIEDSVGTLDQQSDSDETMASVEVVQI